MKLKSFKIQNVMSIKESGQCYLADRITILAGQNESGKTAILKSLDYFRNGADADFKKYAFRGDQSELPQVTCYFETENSDFSEIKDENVTNILKTLKKAGFYRKSSHVVNSTDEYTFDDDTKSIINVEIEKIYKTDFAADDPQTATLTTVQQNKRNSDVKNLYKKIEDAFKAAIPKMVYYDDFNNLLPDSYQINSSKNQAVKDFEALLGIDFNASTTLDHRIWTTQVSTKTDEFKVSFNKYWNQTYMNEAASDYTFQINKDGNTIYFLVDQGDNTPLYIKQKSKGFRWFNSFYIGLRALAFNKESANKPILLIDEPGQGLHETAQEDLKRVLEDLAEQGLTIMYSTHNPILIGVDDHFDRIRLVYKKKNDGTKVNIPSQFVSQMEKGDTQSDYTLRPIRTAMGLKQVCIENDGINILVEGISEKFYFEAFKRLLNIDDSKQKIHFIPAAGVENITNLVSFVLGWGYKFKVIFDKKDKVQKELKKKFYPHHEDTSIYETQIKMLKEEGIEDLFGLDFFNKHVAPMDIERTDSLSNSEFAKNGGKKELWARLFLENVNNGNIKAASVDDTTKGAFQGIFDWIKL